MNVLRRIPGLACRWHRRTLSLLALGALSGKEGSPARAHLACCPVCRKRFAEWQTVADLGRQLGAGLKSGGTTVGRQRSWERRFREEGRGPIRGVVRGSWPPRLAWGGLASAWLLIGLLRWSAPGVSTSHDGPGPISWGEVRMVLGLAQQRAEAREVTVPPAQQPSRTLPKGGPDRDRGAVRELDETRNIG